MKKISKIEDYRKCLKQVKGNGKTVIVENNMTIEESEKVTDKDVTGLDIIMSFTDGKKYDKIVLL
jgi:hypothetical protein